MQFLDFPNDYLFQLSNMKNLLFLSLISVNVESRRFQRFASRCVRNSFYPNSAGIRLRIFRIIELSQNESSFFQRGTLYSPLVNHQYHRMKNLIKPSHRELFERRPDHERQVSCFCRSKSFYLSFCSPEKGVLGKAQNCSIHS